MGRRPKRKPQRKYRQRQPANGRLNLDGRRQRADYRKMWTWLSVLIIPALITAGGVWYSAQLDLDQAGQQEINAQSAANNAIDAELAKTPPLLASVRTLGAPWGTFYYEDAWVFPTVLSESTVRALEEPLWIWEENVQSKGGFLSDEDLNEIEKISDESVKRKRQLGGIFSYSDSALNETPKSRYHISFVGNRRERIRVVDIKATFLSREKPLRGTLLTFPESDSSAGIDDVAKLEFDLDKIDGRPRSITANDAFLDVKSISLEKGEEVALEVAATSETCWCKWQLEIIVSYGNVRHEKVIIRSDGTASGQPFEMAAWNSDWKYEGGHYQRQEGVMNRIR
ncbi:MAG: hypothetical protein LC776_03525 [Acidobacteria bacterium]|nr:hypothetical protein [Acidobacteriota bacterium]